MPEKKGKDWEYYEQRDLYCEKCKRRFNMEKQTSYKSCYYCCGPLGKTRFIWRIPQGDGFISEESSGEESID